MMHAIYRCSCEVELPRHPEAVIDLAKLCAESIIVAWHQDLAAARKLGERIIEFGLVLALNVDRY
jgi:hypothetical protein